jgi:hypothetical protein
MPIDLEQQLARFAEALDRGAPTISLDDLVSRGPVAVDVARLERPSSDRASRVHGAPRSDTAPSHHDGSERDVLIELAPTGAARRPAWRRVVFKSALGAAAVAALVVALAAIDWRGDEPDPAATDGNDGQAGAEAYSFLDGEVTFAAPSPWFCTRSRIGTCGFMVYDHSPTLSTLYFDSQHEGLAVLADPRPVGIGCEPGPAPADAEALAQTIASDPDLGATEPTAVRIAGTDALQLDVVVKSQTSGCADAVVLTADSTPENTAGAWAGQRMRLYLLDTPGGSARILAIAIFTHGQFETVVKAAAPIVDSFQFHTG